ncbi:uncharacterized protein LOC141632205 [Silene latifolia]|uniref:uncharacterized protein LOC141632205 n=1 Tax=Silene latifolia TaxID=37657 RepID=UPI003D783885
MSKWSVHLSGYDIRYDPRTAIKSQALAYFVSNFSPAIHNLADEEILTLKGNKEGDLIAQVVRCEFKATNNETEYEALILGMHLALELRIRNLQRLKYGSLPKSGKGAQTKIQRLQAQAGPQRPECGGRCPSNSGATFKPTKLANIPIGHVLEPSIQKLEEADKGELEDQQDGATVIASTDGQTAVPPNDQPADQKDEWDWRTPYLDLLRHGNLPDGKKEVRGFRMKASRFTLIDNVLFRKSLAGPYLRCLNKQEAQTVLHALQSDECGNHAGGRILSNKALRQGYFWPRIRADSAEYARKCDACQCSAPMIHQPAEPLHPIISPWPFITWGMDIVGPLPKATGNKLWMLAMTDYFSKWIEVEALTEGN